MDRAQKRDALLQQKFWFAQSLMPTGSDCAHPMSHPEHDATASPKPHAAASRKMRREKVRACVARPRERWRHEAAADGCAAPEAVAAACCSGG
jgi:hypothetical protein